MNTDEREHWITRTFDTEAEARRIRADFARRSRTTSEIYRNTSGGFEFDLRVYADYPGDTATTGRP